MSPLRQVTQAVQKNAVYDIDAAHSSAEFAVKHLMIATVKGRVPIATGTVNLHQGQATVEAELDIGAIETGVAQRDAHLRSADFFDAANHPAMTFRSAGPLDVAAPRFELAGELTISGVTRPITLHVENEGEARDPWGKQRVALNAKTTIDRSQWGLTWNQALETGGIMVGDKVNIELHLSLVERAPQ